MVKTAIVIDDDELVNESLTSILELIEIKVVGRGYDGKEAVDLFSKHSPDYSLIDLSMPNFDGFYAIEKIKKQNKNAQICVLTGDVTRETKEKLHDIGVEEIIFKPYDLNTLKEHLNLSKTPN